jgi:hypothetical protein
VASGQWPVIRSGGVPPAVRGKHFGRMWLFAQPQASKRTLLVLLLIGLDLWVQQVNWPAMCVEAALWSWRFQD